MRTRNRTLRIPAARFIELANALEQSVPGGIEVHRQSRDLLTQLLDGKHEYYYTLVQCIWQ